MRTLVLEGVNGAGKTTVGELLRDRLIRSGQCCVAADPAGRGRLGGLSRKNLVSTSFAHGPDIDALLFASLRLDGVNRLLRENPELSDDGVLVLERWSLALGAYGAVDGARSDLVGVLQRVLDETISADLTLLLDVPPCIAEARMADTPEENRFQSRGIGYLERLRASHLGSRVSVGQLAVVDASLGIDETLERVDLALKGGSFDV